MRIMNNVGVRIADSAFAVRSVEEWFKAAPPQKGLDQWKDGKSAKELAKAWFPYPGSPQMPPRLKQLLESHELTRHVSIEKAFPERIVKLDTFGGKHRHADLVLEARSSLISMVMHVEAKADERFGNHTIGGELSKSKPSSNVPCRVENLCGLLFRKPFVGDGARLVGDGTRPLKDPIKQLRYQLLFGVAAAVLDARRLQSSVAVFIVHELVPRDLRHVFVDEQDGKHHVLRSEQIKQNEEDLARFLRELLGEEPKTPVRGKLIKCGYFVPPDSLEWEPERGRQKVQLLVGKATDYTA